MPVQPAIFASIPSVGHFVVLGLVPDASPPAVVAALAKLAFDDSLIVGLGAPLVSALGKQVPGLRAFPAVSGTGVAVPSTQGSLVLHLRGEDHGVVLHSMRRVIAALGAGLRIEEEIVAYRYSGGRDLSGYEDGTENPKGDAATTAAIVAGAGAGLDGGSFVAVQRWVHQLARLDTLSVTERDHLIGRHHETNEELADAPARAHVKRAAQESFDPPAFMWRRSMPYGNLAENGLMFVAYGATLDAYERVLRRMVGIDDGIVDGLFQFSRPLSGGYYWCPPVRDKRLDLSRLA